MSTLQKGFGDWATEVEAAEPASQARTATALVCPPCTQNCRQGRGCPACASQMSMWDLEGDNPVWLLVYALVVVGTVAACVVMAA